MNIDYHKKESILNLTDKYSSDTLLTAGFMKLFCNENEDNIDICKKCAQIVSNDANIVEFFNNYAFKNEKSVLSCLKEQLVGTGNSWLCYFIRSYLSQKGIEAFLYNDKTTGKLICLILDEMTKRKLSVYIQSIGFFNSAKENSDIGDVHFFSYPFIQGLGITCMTNLEIVDFLCEISQDNTYPKVDFFKINDELIYENEDKLIKYFEKEIYNCSPLFCLVGPSGCGKTSIANCLEMKGLKSVASYTTRKPRFKGEQGHTFISEEEFETLRNDMISTTHFSGYNYGITPQLLNQSDIFVVDPAGVKELKEKYHSRPIVVMLCSCSEDTCKKRMLERGDEPESANVRIEHDRKVFAGFEKYADIIIPAENGFSQVLNFVTSSICEILNPAASTNI